ncbi:MAG: TlpA family protein disulfide reductase [Cytophagaceae bacterium]|nr:TlpA family protein disulfide reductase [Cytophagaceae bacterium]
MKKTFVNIILIQFLLFFIAKIELKAQKVFRISGKISGFEENSIGVTIYKNWVEEPLAYDLKLDKKKQFVFETVLEDIAYFDLNIGEYGFYQWKIEPGDNINFSANYADFHNSIKISGEGSTKFQYLLEQENKFTKEKDWDFELQNLRKISRKGYFDLTNYLRNEQLNLLNKYKKELSESFYSLQRADIIGKYYNSELGFLMFHKIFSKDELKTFDFKIVNAKTQAKSLEFGIFIEQLIDNTNATAKKYPEDKLVEIESIKDYFESLDLVERPLLERIIATKIIQFIEKDGATEENKLMVGSFKNYAKNPAYVNAILKKIIKYQEVETGRQVKNFILPDEKGNLVSLKDYRGKNIILINYASWCGPCVQDLEYLKVVLNYFKAYNDLVLIAVSTDTKEDFESFVKASKNQAINLNAYEIEDYKENFNTDFLPNYLLIDKTGTIIIDKIEEPSLDEGRSLIRQIESLIYKK